MDAFFVVVLAAAVLAVGALAVVVLRALTGAMRPAESGGSGGSGGSGKGER